MAISPKQIGLRLEQSQLNALDKFSREKGMDRTSVIRWAINEIIAGNSGASSDSPGGAVVDLPAREQLTKLAAKVNLLAAGLAKHQERIDALEATKEEAASAPFELDL